MDEPTGDLMPPPEKKSRPLVIIIELLLIVGIVGGYIAYFGIDSIKDQMTQLFHKSDPAPDVAQAPPPAPAPTPVPEDPSLVLARAFVSADATQRKVIVGQLAGLETPVAPAIEFLVTSLPTSAPDVKLGIVSALGMLAKKDPTAIPPLINSLDDKTLRAEAIKSLAPLGPSAKAAIPKLKKIAANKKEKKSIRTSAQKALTQIQGKKPTKSTKKRSKKTKK